MADFRRRNQVQHTVHHSEAGTENRHNCHFLTLQLLNCGIADGRGDFHIGKRQASRGFVADEHGNLAYRLPEILRTCLDSPDIPDFVLNQRMLHNIYVFHVEPPLNFILKTSEFFGFHSLNTAFRMILNYIISYFL